ncbi:MAG: ABC transporter permease [Treponema sp.]|nr:ABC transporter permease [Treponema sp.]
MGKSGSMHTIIARAKNSTSFGIVIILLAMCLILTIAVGRVFLSSDNLVSVVRQFSFIAIMAIGESIVIMTGGIDLSVGSIFAFASVIGCMVMTKLNLGTAGGLLSGLLVGAGMGAANGLFITRLKLPPFIATLGMMSIARGLSFGVTGGFPISMLPDSFKFIGQGYVGFVPAPVIILILLTVIFGVFMHKSITGRRIYAIGGNEEAARLSGVRIERIKILVYTLSGLLAGLAGLMTAGRLGVAQSTAGNGYEMDAISATIIGGASLAGGVGNIAGPILGAAIMQVLRNGLVLTGVSAYWQQAVLGAVIIIAVAFDKLRQIKKK